MKSLVLTVLCLLSFPTMAQQGAEPILKSHAAPVYPPLARQARIQGDVKIEFGVDRDGVPVAVNLISGHPLLAPAALETVKAWRFQMPADHWDEDRKYSATIEFKFPSEGNAQNRVAPADEIPPFLREEVIASFPDLPEIQVSDCPSEPDSRPPTSRVDGDFVEISRSECYGTCPAYTLRVKADGELLWEGRSYVSAKGKRRASVTAEQARALIDKFSTKEFWQLCGLYSKPITDNPTTTLDVSIDGRTKSVSNYANSAPPWVRDLEISVDSIAPIHSWQNGDPKKEPLSRIGNDRYFFKPGVTPLMRAAIRKDTAQIRTLLAEGASVNDVESSGWTVLMYAAASGKLEPVQMILQAGANPNQTSSRGDTPLMAAAFRGEFVEDLVRAGAKVNAQNRDGVSVLMILAANGEPDEVKAALKNGASPSLKDDQGRSALDYLRLANCGKSPVQDVIMSYPHSKGCGHLDEDDIQKIKQLLRAAVR